MRAETHPLEILIRRGDGPLSAAIVFLAVLGYPEESEQHQRDRAARAMRAWYGRQFAALGGPPAHVGSLVRQLPAANMRRILRRLQDRLDRRLRAGSVFGQLLMKVRRPTAGEGAELALVRQSLVLGKSHAEIEALVRQLPATRSRKGSHWGLKAFADASGEGDAFYSRTWKASALPLAFALYSVRLRWSDPRGFSVSRLLANPEWAPQALVSADAWARFLPQVGDLPCTLAKTVHKARFVRFTFLD